MPKLKLNSTAVYLLWTLVMMVLWTIGTSFSLPSLGELPGAWLRLVKEEGLIYELGVSLRLTGEALLLSSLISVGLAYASVTNLFNPLVKILTKFRFFGMAGFTIIFTRIFGGGHALKLSLLVFIVSVFFVTSMVDVVASATKEEFDHARSLGMGRFRSVCEVVILGKLDQTFDALRQNAAMGWAMLTLVEGLVKFEGGVGVIMLAESKYRNLAAVFATQLTVLVVGIIIDQLIGLMKSFFCPYASLSLEQK